MTPKDAKPLTVTCSVQVLEDVLPGKDPGRCPFAVMEFGPGSKEERERKLFELEPVCTHCAAPTSPLAFDAEFGIDLSIRA